LLRRVFDLEAEEVIENCKKCIVRSYIHCIIFCIKLNENIMESDG
jgi:hypothetical protein